MYVVGTLVLLVGLPVLVRRYFGPVRPGWAPRAARFGGYAVVLVTIRLADHDARSGILTPPRQALLATTCAMATAAMLVALFTSLTIALLPHHVPQQPAGDGICHNCEPPTIVIPPNLRHEYYVEGSVGGAGGGTLLALLIVPLVGAAIAAGRNPLPPSRPVSAQPGPRT
jgi:hypothetical protein